MKKRDILPLLYQIASPAAMILLGLVLMISPDTASALLARLLGWGLTLVGICIGIFALVNRRGAVGKGIAAVLCVCTGGFLTANPLVLAAGLGRILGILVAARGLRDLFLAKSRGYGGLLPLITALVGLVLVVLPMTTSRLVFALLGAILAGLGAAMLFDRLKNRRYLEGGNDPNIIDAL